MHGMRKQTGMELVLLQSNIFLKIDHLKCKNKHPDLTGLKLIYVRFGTSLTLVAKSELSKKTSDDEDYTTAQ